MSKLCIQGIFIYLHYILLLKAVTRHIIFNFFSCFLKLLNIYICKGKSNRY